MIKKNMPMIVITSLITMLPAMATGLMMPIVLLLTHLLCIFATSKDARNEDQNQKVFRMVFWICPILSVYVSCINYAVKNNMEIGMDVFTVAVIGLMFVFIGNYLPKCKPNYTIGIKIPWVYTSDENWNKTHRLGGKVWVLGGLVIMFSIFLPGSIGEYLMIMLFAVMIIVPIFYSYLFYKKEKEAGKADAAKAMPGKMSKTSAIFLIIILAFVAVMMFTGNIEFTCGDTELSIKASYWEDMTVEYDEVKSIEYFEDGVDGSRVSGFGSARLLMGNFKNDKYGYYTRYSYTQCDSAIVLTLEDTELVISTQDVEKTKELYVELVDKLR